MYLLRHLPNEVLVFDCGSRITQKRRLKCAKQLKSFVHDNYPQSEMDTVERYIPVLNNFTKYRTFEQTNRGYKTENSQSVGFKPVHVIKID